MSDKYFVWYLSEDGDGRRLKEFDAQEDALAFILEKLPRVADYYDEGEADALSRFTLVSGELCPLAIGQAVTKVVVNHE